VILAKDRNYLSQPLADTRNWLVKTAAQLCLNRLQLGYQSFLRCLALHDEAAVAAAFPTVVGEPQKREGFRLSLATFSPVSDGEPSELDQPWCVAKTLLA
jgi:hypothetical protein